MPLIINKLLKTPRFTQLPILNKVIDYHLLIWKSELHFVIFFSK